MKILIVAHYFAPHTGGIEIVAENQAKQLASNGHDITVLTSNVYHEYSSLNETNNNHFEIVKIKALNVLENKLGVPFPIFSPKIIANAYKLVKASDLVHAHDVFYQSTWAVALFAKILKKPFILTQHVAMVPHNIWVVELAQRLVYRTFGKYVFNASERIVVINARVKDFLIEYGVSQDKIVQLMNGTDVKQFHPVSKSKKCILRKSFSLPQDRILVLFVGRFVPKKGFDKLWAASHSKYTIVFVGGDKPPEYKKNKNIIFLGKVSRENMAQIYQACDIFALPSVGEGFPLSIQEAMSTGMPIVTVNDIGYRNYGLDKSLICFVRPIAADIKKQLIQITHDDYLRRKMGRYSLRYARKHFDWKTTVNNLSSMYEEVLR